MSPVFPTTRLRRLRQSDPLRALVRETTVTANDLIQPLFVEEGIDEPLPIAEMPGVSRIPERKLEHAVEGLARDGVKALMLFGISHHKDATGSDAWNRDGLVARMVRRAKRAAPGAGGHPRHLLLRIHRPRPLRRDRARPCGERRDHREPGAPGRGRGRGRCRHGRAVGHDGRPGRRDPRCAGCGGPHRHADHGLLDQVRIGVLWAVPRRGGLRAARATARPTRWIR